MTLESRLTWVSHSRNVPFLFSSSHHSLLLLFSSIYYDAQRHRGHPYELPEYCTNLHKKYFIIQSLYLYI